MNDSLVIAIDALDKGGDLGKSSKEAHEGILECLVGIKPIATNREQDIRQAFSSICT